MYNAALSNLSMEGEMANLSTVFIGLKGAVAALDRSTGTKLWFTKLKGSDFVNLTLAENELYAATKGELYCLEPATGQIRWHNPLEGMGLGLVSIAAPGSQANPVAMAKHKQGEDAAATAAVIAAGA
jgi:outer membrane protein assembly factor BamB